jgi:hypothetical protein
MNLSDITTPADLVKQNDISPAKDFVNQLDELGPAEALAVTQMLVNKLHQLHCNMAQRDDVSSPLAWAKDAGMLEVAMNILNNIEL